ncbi:MAG: TIR domain-containing protein, partial [Pseudomonadota bacterium]
MSDERKAVFLSYASQDAEAAKRICDALRAGGVEVWFDTDGGLEHGDEWDAKIRHQIKECALFIPVISANTQARREGYFRLEWKLADDRTHLMARGTPFLLPVCVDGAKDAAALVPDSFHAVQWFQWNRWGSRDVPAALVSRVRELLEIDVPGRAVGPAPARPAMPLPPVAPKPREKTIAVLAFANLSRDPENEYFSDGISEELLNVLAKIPGLRVTARTSAFFFKGRNVPVPEIAEKL